MANSTGDYGRAVSGNEEDDDVVPEEADLGDREEGGPSDWTTDSGGRGGRNKKAKGTDHVLLDDQRVHVGNYPTSKIKQWLNTVLKGPPIIADDGGLGLMSE